MHSRKIFWIAHNKNHFEIFEQSRELLITNGATVSCAAIEGFPPPAAEQFRHKGIATLARDDVRRTVVPGDAIVVGNDWLPASLCDLITDLTATGVRTVAFVEGCRFTLPNKYTRVSELLGWGPSASRLPPKRVHIVGSPVLESALRLSRHAAKDYTLVNYRFKPIASERGTGRAWLEAVTDACTRAGSPIVISAHPASGLVDTRYKVSAEPIEQLLPRAALLISRCSTLIYQALLAGVPAILFPTREEELGELADPKGAYAIVTSADDLIKVVSDHLEGKHHHDTSDFLACHVNIDPRRPASLRMAEALLGHRLAYI